MDDKGSNNYLPILIQYSQNWKLSNQNSNWLSVAIYCILLVVILIFYVYIILQTNNGILIMILTIIVIIISYFLLKKINNSNINNANKQNNNKNENNNPNTNEYFDNKIGDDKVTKSNREFDSAAEWIYDLPETCKENQEKCLRYEDVRYIR